MKKQTILLAVVGLLAGCNEMPREDAIGLGMLAILFLAIIAPPLVHWVYDWIMTKRK